LLATNPDRIKKDIKEDDMGKFIMTSKRIKVTPHNTESYAKINDALAASRKIWNCCVTAIQKSPDLKMEELRDMFVSESKMSSKLKKQMKWTFRTAQKVREAVTRRFHANYNTSKDNLKKSQYKHYYKVKKVKGKKKVKKIAKKVNMRFREKSNEKQSIYLNKEICKFRVCEITNKTILETFNGVSLTLDETYTDFNKETTCPRCQYIAPNDTTLKAHLARKNPCQLVDPNSIPHAGIPQAEMILQRVGYEYYLYVPEYKESVIIKEAKNDIVAIDAGWNTLLTYYSPDNEWGEICPGIKKKLDSLRTKINKIKSLNITQKTKIKAVKKRTNYITNMMDDLHWKICHWLLSKYRKIIISRLYVANVSKTAKQTQADLNLCQFVNRLIDKSIEYKNSEIHICKEHYTSQACTKCLSLNTVKDSTVKCKDCKFEIHRDLNGARNIFLKHCF
jgi:transposase